MNPGEKDAEARLALFMRELKAHGADDAVLNLSSDESLLVKFSNSAISNVKRWDLTMLSVFASFGKRIVVTTVRDVSKKGLKAAAGHLGHAAKHLVPNGSYRGIADGPFTYKSVPRLFDQKIADRDHAEEFSLSAVGDIFDAAKARGVGRIAGVLETGKSSTLLMTTGHVREVDSGTRAYLSVRALKSKSATGHMAGCSRMLSSLDVEGITEKAMDIATQAVRPRLLAQGTYDVVFESLPFADMLNHLALGCSVFYVEAGLSCLKDRLGTRVASPLLTLADHGRLPDGYGSSSFDEEGVPSQRTVLVKDGVLRSYLHNTSTARRYGTKSTGSAGLIAPGVSNIEVVPGKHSLDGLFSHVKTGVYITNLWYTRFNNYAAGDFSTMPRDGMFLIKNGRLSHPVRGVRVSDNLLRMMGSVTALGKETPQLRSWEVEKPTLAPAAVVRGVPLTRPER